MVTIEVSLETIQNGNTELLLCEARDYLDNNSFLKPIENG